MDIEAASAPPSPAASCAALLLVVVAAAPVVVAGAAVVDLVVDCSYCMALGSDARPVPMVQCLFFREVTDVRRRDD
ncbi:MAG: hypothetical protein FJ102_02450 [Deltaproteobacteria bacterium]|nr:hypothetical protein [Deltaproteobacteria bacterium]